MRSDSLQNVNPITLARACLTSPGDIELLKIYQFIDDEDSHNDVKQSDLERTFGIAFSESVKQLEAEFGLARIAKSDSEIDIIPLCGVFRAAFWEVDGKTLFVAAAHEDREAPYLLMVGTL